MRCFRLDGRHMQRTADGYVYIYEQMHVCACAGKNLDALYDVLTEIGQMTEIQIEFADEMDPMIKKVMLNAANVNECLKIILTK